MSGRTIRISGAQLVVSNDVPDNERRILGAIERAAADKADFLLTPEGSLSGYWAGFDAGEVAEATERVAAAAREAGTGLALGTCYKVPADHGYACYNQVRIYAPDGEFLGYHAKILRCSPLDLPGTGEMKDYVEGTLRTFEWRGIRFGALICNDLWATPGWTTMPNPYLPWQLHRMGAEFILHAVNSGTGLINRPFHESSVALWALKLGIPIVEVNASKSEHPVNARSGVMGPEGDWLFMAPDTGEPQFTYEISL
jgi:predicted amidohydrolase